MLINLTTLQQELPALKGLELKPLCELIASLGFPIDGVDLGSGTTVLDVDVTANRGDLMSHRGLARDLAAKLGESLTPIQRTVLKEGEAKLPIRLEADACALYATAVLTLGSKQSVPSDVQAFLQTLGSNPKLLAAVDASNEILHRYGHPTHAFDADTLKGGITVRWAKAGESLLCLDGVERKLTAADLVIADGSGPIALAGVMGGDGTKVTATTKRVLLECAYFDPKVVRAMARRHSLHTDGSHRFGRGADPAMPKVARDLLAQRLVEWAGATVDAAWTIGAEPPTKPAISLTEALLARIAGEAISLDEATDLLHRLGCTVLQHPGGLAAVPPSWRHDLSISEDLAEEVLRLRGYDRIPSALPPLDADPEPLSDGYNQQRSIAHRLAHLGFHQTVTLGFISPEVDATLSAAPQAGRTLGNPLGVEYSVMRGSLLPSLKHTAEHNLRQGAKEVRLFEISPVYSGDPRVAPMALGIVWGGMRGGEDPLTPARSLQSADLLGVIQELGAKATVRELDGGLFGLELALMDLPRSEARIIPTFQSFSRFPAVERDLSLLVDLTQIHGALVTAMGKGQPKELQDLRCVDIFRHKSLPAGKQAWLMRLRFQAEDRTLTSEEVDAWVKQALHAAESLGATLRG